MSDTRVPDFSLPATGGKTIDSANFRDKTTILYFYPKDNTPGCTNETRDFALLYPQFADAGCEVFGISRDSVASHEKFKAKLDLPFELISDSDEIACKAFDVIKMKKMYGKEHRGVKRSTFVIDGAGNIVKAWRGVKVAEHAQKVLDYVRDSNGA